MTFTKVPQYCLRCGLDITNGYKFYSPDGKDKYCYWCWNDWKVENKNTGISYKDWRASVVSKKQY